jgi:hypothetical protein
MAAGDPIKCDFCGKEGYTRDEYTILPLDRFEVVDVIVNFSKSWGACPECSPYLVADDWTGLLERAIANHPRGELVREPLRRTYLEGLRAHQNAPLRGWLPIDDEEDEFG